MVVEFWLADWFGRAWLRLHSSLRPALGDLPGECALVARGEQMPAGRLWRAQDFAARVWWRFAMVMCLLLFPFGFALGVSAQLGLQAAETALMWLLYSIGAAMMAGIGQAAMMRHRSGENQRSWTMRLASREEPLPEWSDGLPRRSDFWLVTLLTVGVFLILLYAGTRSPHQA